MATYPQLDVQMTSRYPHHMSSELADMVRGEFVFKYLNHETKVFRISGLIKMFNLVMSLGDLEHTGDWDWRISVRADGHVFDGDVWVEGDDSASYMSDDISLDYEVEPGDYTSGFSRWEFLTMQRFHNDGESSTIQIPIRSIDAIIIEEA